MARFEDIKTIISTYIKPNGNEEITGEILQNVLMAMLEAVDIVVDEVVAAFPQISGSEFVDVLENKVSLLLDPQGHLGNTGRGLGVVMDKVMSDDSLNPVSNKVVKTYVDKIKSDLDALVGGDLSSAIDNFNEILEFLSSIEDSETLSGIIAGLETSLKKYAESVAQAAYEQSYADSVAASSAYTDGEIAALAATIPDVSGKQDKLVSGQNIKTINGQSILGSGNIEIQGGGGATPRVEMTAESASIEPNKFYVWPMMDALDLTLGAEQSGVMNRYLFQFRNPKAGLTMLTLPDTITWSEDTELDENGLPVMEAAAFYRIEIIEGLASLKKWKLVYINFADAEVERVLMSNGVGDGIGITKKDAAALSSLGGMFRGGSKGSTFAEFVNFKNVTSLNPNGQWNSGEFYQSSIKKLALPPSITAIAYCSFFESAIEEVTFSDNVTEVGNEGFGGCRGYKSSPPRAARRLGASSFYNCSAMASVVDCPFLEEIGAAAFTFSAITGVGSLGNVTQLLNQKSDQWYGVFQGCTSLKFVVLPATMEYIEYVAFASCTAMQVMVVKAITPPTLTGDAFDGASAFAIYVPDASIEAYKAATNWSKYADRIRGVAEINSHVLYDEIKQYL